MRTLRENAKMSRTQLAEKADLNARTIEAYEQGRKDINNAKIKTLLKLCIAHDFLLLHMISYFCT